MNTNSWKRQINNLVKKAFEKPSEKKTGGKTSKSLLVSQISKVVDNILLQADADKELVRQTAFRKGKTKAAAETNQAWIQYLMRLSEIAEMRALNYRLNKIAPTPEASKVWHIVSIELRSIAESRTGTFFPGIKDEHVAAYIGIPKEELDQLMATADK